MRFSENARCPVLRLRTSNHAIGPGSLREIGPVTRRVAGSPRRPGRDRDRRRRASLTAPLACWAALGHLAALVLPSAPELLAQRHDALRGAHVARAGFRALERGVATPGAGVLIGPVEDRIAVGSRGLLEQALRVGERGRSDVGVVGRGDRARRQAEAALDAVLVPLSVPRCRRLSPPRAGARSLARSDAASGKRATKVGMSTTTSCSTGRFAIGSTVIVPEKSESGVTHASRSRPFTRTPHVPHEAWKHEWRSPSDGSSVQLDPPERLEHGRAFVDRHVDTRRVRRVVAALEAVHPEPASSPSVRRLHAA